MDVVIPAAEADRSIHGRGTDETRWRGWAGWQRSPVELTDLVSGRLIVVAPHPDDETLAAGGLIRACARAGRPVLVIAVTDGGGSHPGSTVWPPDRLLAQRRLERVNALRRLGIDAARVIRLEVPDGQVTAHRHTVVKAVRERARSGDTIVVPWRWDGHPDHEATCEATELAVQTRDVRLLQAPIWGWHWASPEVLPAHPLLFRLDRDGRQRKRNAIAEFSSQLEPDLSTGAEAILPYWALPRWLREFEVFLDG